MKRYGAVGAIAGLCVAQTLVGSDHRLLALLFFVGALTIWGALVRSAHKADFQALRARFLLPVVGILAVAMVVIPPATSKDFNSYALYGRMAAEYGASPYTHVPRDFAADAWFERTSYYWSDSPSVYGPVFTGVSIAVMEVAGESVGLARAGFGAFTLLALLAAMALLAKRCGWRRSAVLLGLNPLILTFGVNDLHCDLMVGTAVLAAVLALERGRAAVAGVALAIAVAVKITALPALAGAAVWLLFRRRMRSAAAMLVAAAAVLIVGFLAVGGLDAIAPITDASGRQTRFSVWNPVADLLTNWVGSAPPTLGAADQMVGVASSLVVAIVGLGLIWRYRRHATPVATVVAGLVAYQLFGAYVLSWYALWSLPALGLMYRSPLAGICMAHGAWLAIAYLSGWAGLALALAAVVWWMVWNLRANASKKTIEAAS